MIEVPSRSSLADLDTDKLVALSERWVNEPQKKNNPKTKFDIIRTLESGIRSLIALGYTYKEVSNKLTSELNMAISGETVRKYLQKIDVENKKAAAKAKRDATKAAKALDVPALSVLLSEPANMSNSLPSSPPISQNPIDTSYSDAQPTITRTNSDLKQTTQVESSRPQSIVPKSVPVDDDDDDDYLAQQKILKHYNRY
jgi:hypothetical protein